MSTGLNIGGEGGGRRFQPYAWPIGHLTEQTVKPATFMRRKGAGWEYGFIRPSFHDGKHVHEVVGSGSQGQAEAWMAVQ